VMGHRPSNRSVVLSFTPIQYTPCLISVGGIDEISFAIVIGSYGLVASSPVSCTSSRLLA
jgi:hypothetical protein